MKTDISKAIWLLFPFIFLFGCLDEGDHNEADAGDGVDCGDNGSAHGDHCHCYAGYLFNGETCVEPEEITEQCVDHEENHVHHACVCPETGTCPCDGTIEEYGGKQYCVPEMH